MQQKGWIKLHRKITESAIWDTGKPFSEREAWIDILLLANHSEKKVIIDGKAVTVGCGEHITSLRKLADRWHVSPNTARRYLKLFENLGMIYQKSAKRCTTLKVRNYQYYQGVEDSDETEVCTKSDTKSEQSLIQSLNTNKKYKNDKNDKNDISSVYKAFNNSLRLTSARPYPSISKVYREEDGHGRELNEELPFGDM